MSEQPKDLTEQAPEQETAVQVSEPQAIGEPIVVEAPVVDAAEAVEPVETVQPQAAAALSVGAVLRAARESQQLSLADVSGRIKFTEKQIVSLETDDYGALPEGAFLRGLVRSYARALQLDESSLIEALPQPTPPVAPVPEESAQPVRLKGSGAAMSDRTKLVIGMIAGLAVVAGIALNLPAKKQEAAPAVAEIALPIPASGVIAEPVAVEVAASSAAPVAEAESASQSLPATTPAAPAIVVPPMTPPAVPTPPAKVEEVKPALAVQTPAPVVDNKPVAPAKPQAVVPVPAVKPAETGQAKPAAPVAGGEVRLVFDDLSWTEVRDGKGNVLLSQRNHPGSEKVLSGAPPFNLVIGNAKAVHLYYRGKEVPLNVGANGSVARLKLE